MDPTLLAQIQPYQPWLIIAGAVILFFLLRVTRKRLRQRVDEVGYRMLGERGALIWFWMNAPGVMLHELSHALVVLLFMPFGFRLTSVAPLFGGIVMMLLLYWVVTGYNIWEIQQNISINHLQLLKPGWPWWTLIS